MHSSCRRSERPSAKPTCSFSFFSCSPRLRHSLFQPRKDAAALIKSPMPPPPLARNPPPHQYETFYSSLRATSSTATTFVPSSSLVVLPGRAYQPAASSWAFCLVTHEDVLATTRNLSLLHHPRNHHPRNHHPLRTTMTPTKLS